MTAVIATVNVNTNSFPINPQLNWYHLFIDLLTLVFIVVMARHTILRSGFFLHIYQQMGYRSGEFWNWMLDHWNRRVLTPAHILFNLVLLLMLWMMSSTITGSAAVIILSLFAIFWFGPFTYYRGSRRKKPLVYTARVRRLLIPFVLISLVIPFFTTTSAILGYVPFTGLFIRNTGQSLGDIYILAFGWVLADALVPFWVMLAGKIMRPLENRIHRGFIRQAKEKLRRMPDLTVIAITGSYGKTSTKFMIRDLLGERYRVCSTPGSYNTPMGICQVINDDLQALDQVLILEMGARYEGNIDELCDIAQPDIAVVTNVGIAHLETFGSRDAIARTKSTLVKRLKANGTAVLNTDDERVAAMESLRQNLTVVRTGIETGEVRAEDISYDHEGTRFTLLYEGQQEPVRTALLGAHNVQNLLLAAGVALHMGLRLKTIALAARQIEPVEHRLELKKQGELLVIDDAFNSNPTGARNAVEILSQFNSGRRIIITPGMIELGELQDEKNREFGEAIGRAELDLVILVGEQRTRPILQGIEETGFDPDKVKVAESLFQANELMREYAVAGDVILYENDLPDSFDE